MDENREQAFLESVGDDDCTTILNAVRNEDKTIPELSDECDIPLSTAYRKVNLLQEADLVEERNRLPKDCRPKNVYGLSFDAAILTMAEDGSFEVQFVDEPIDGAAVDSPGVLARSPVESD